MKFTGQWHNPDYAGEGITSIEYPDGKVIAYFFSYHDDGSQMWLVCVGGRVGRGAVLSAYRTEGGVMGVKARLTEVTEEKWGEIALHEDDKGLLIDFFKDGTRDGGYRLTPLYAPVAEPETIIKLEKKIGNGWTKVEYPVTGRMMDSAESAYRLTVVKGELNITEAYATGKFNPRIYGVFPGATFSEGSEVLIDFSMADGWQQDGANYDWGAWFAVRTKELGTILDLAVQVKS